MVLLWEKIYVPAVFTTLLHFKPITAKIKYTKNVQDQDGVNLLNARHIA